ncbi:unnamed protein product [Orchesella dallaii]|uniref:Anaphase-promoting complex subunit 16 n=1 Tax=Orchesella dallaii TaxID=48710 RepID=A0ABP1PPU3_9HEXA
MSGIRPFHPSNSNAFAMSRSAASPDIINISSAASEPSASARASSTSSSDDKVLHRFTSNLLAETSKIKVDQSEHGKRLNFLRREADRLEKTDWQYEPVEKLLGK